MYAEKNRSFNTCINFRGSFWTHRVVYVLRLVMRLNDFSGRHLPTTVCGKIKIIQYLDYGPRWLKDAVKMCKNTSKLYYISKVLEFTKTMQYLTNFNVFSEGLGRSCDAFRRLRRLHDAPRWRQGGPRWREDEPRRCQDAPETAQDGANCFIFREALLEHFSYRARAWRHAERTRSGPD